MRRHVGSTIALVVGVVSLIAGLTNPSPTLDAGLYLILGALGVPVGQAAPTARSDRQPRPKGD